MESLKLLSLRKIKLMECLVCNKGNLKHYSIIDEVHYFECDLCQSLCVDQTFLSCNSNKKTNYGKSYWELECFSSRERSYGSSVSRVGEVFLYARREINAFIDIGSGPGYLLDSLSSLLPNIKNIFHGIELYPPPKQYQSKHANYHIGALEELDDKFDAGVCVEVIEHLAPDQLENVISQLAIKSNPQALFYFNSAQPSFVKNHDPGYLDPHIRGHIFSYSLIGLASLFERHGFTLIPMPARDWGFLVEYQSIRNQKLSFDDLMSRVWTALPENVEKLRNNLFGNYVYTSALEAARCYYETEMTYQRASWGRSLQDKLKSLNK